MGEGTGCGEKEGEGRGGVPTEQRAGSGIFSGSLNSPGIVETVSKIVVPLTSCGHFYRVLPQALFTWLK